MGRLKMNIIDIIIKKRLKYEQRLGSIFYRLLAPIKLLIILGATVFILRTIFSGNLLENSTVITILTIMIIVGIIYSFDFLYVIAYVIAKKSIKSQIIETKYKREMGKSIRKMGKYKQEMEESKQELEQIELIQQISHGIILGKISNFLRDNKGKAFTFRALDNRIEKIFEDPNEKEYCKRNLQNILKELTSKGSIKSVQRGDVTHYFF